MLTPSAMEGPQDSVVDHEQYRLRMSGHGRLSIGAEDSARRLADDISLGSHDYSDILMEMKDLDPQDPLVSDWHTDPYEADPEAAVHYVESYFTHVNDRLYYMFPRKRFLLWLRSCNTKTSEDTMLLYSMMTLGAVFSDRPDKVTALKRYSRTARYAVEHSRHALTLQLAQSRIIIGLWYYAIGSLVPAWDAIGSAVRTVCGLRYNVESGGVIVDQSRPCEYGLHPQALIECRRRTFWVAYLMDVSSSGYPPLFSRLGLIIFLLAHDLFLYALLDLYFGPGSLSETSLPGGSIRGAGIYYRALFSKLPQSSTRIS